MVINALELLFLLIALHALADYPLQSEFMAKHKVPNGVLFQGQVIWPWVLGAHSFIHGLLAGIATSSLAIAVAETVCHFAIDYQKGKGRLSYGVDQALHIGCKVLWVAAVMLWPEVETPA